MFLNRIVITLLLTICYLLSPASNTEAYEKSTHRDLSNRTIQYSCLQDADYLKSIGINSIYETFNGSDLIKWIELGADEEDSFPRAINHFHNPLHQWSDAGLNDFFNGESSLLWAQDEANEFSWQNARQYYSDALTSSFAASRETGFANVFETLGHLLHLVQDSASPPHTRNDAHVLVASGYEGWANSNPGAISNYASPFSVAVDLGVSVEGYKPITQFFDTNQYMGFAPSTSNTQGLAEYTNANFASEHTIFTENFFPDHIHYFPFPRRADTEEYDQDMGGRYRTYFKKNQPGEVIEHFAVAGRFYRYLPWWPEVQIYFIGFDDLCHAEYAQKLIPRAVGYSTALLDYFFRGDMDLIENPDNPDGYVIVNKTEEEMNGTFELYYDSESDERVKLPGENGGFPVETSISAGGKSENIDFTPPDNAKEPGKYILVFRGQMGSEADAVVGKVVDGIKACAPDPFYFTLTSAFGDVLTSGVSFIVKKSDGSSGGVNFAFDSETNKWKGTISGEEDEGGYRISYLTSDHLRTWFPFSYKTGDQGNLIRPGTYSDTIAYYDCQSQAYGEGEHCVWTFTKEATITANIPYKLRPRIYAGGFHTYYFDRSGFSTHYLHCCHVTGTPHNNELHVSTLIEGAAGVMATFTSTEGIGGVVNGESFLPPSSVELVDVSTEVEYQGSMSGRVHTMTMAYSMPGTKHYDCSAGCEWEDPWPFHCEGGYSYFQTGEDGSPDFDLNPSYLD